MLQQLVKKLTKRFVRPYIVEEVVLKNVMKLKLLASMKIYLVINISRVVGYKELIKELEVEKPKLIEFDIVER